MKSATQPPQPPTQTRRERLRAETSAEIKAVALRLMADGGPDAISLRAIAREMGMTAGAIYGYFDTRDALVTALIVDVYSELLAAVEGARDRLPADDVAGRIVAWGVTLRAWAIANPEGFRLIYGDSLRGYEPPLQEAVTASEKRACEGLTALIAEAWPSAANRYCDEVYAWADFDEALVEKVRTAHPDLPPAGAAVAMRVWGRMYGLVALEVFGRLSPLAHDPARLYEDELKALVRDLGLTPA
ncbi:TetR/AcrR family transcriptional regulator [Yinghuangia seranimata]|uniref:TetR/AcrR family transcriptional regulator n=1 Tax=Yinghuangia seranimata TaxID=408067 RepID=UPI00248BFFE0|nr:TetR/AcrR family transcriptional regulator [Yinghuangia seranimata]MDI2130607.1 TetR/AcrR family transcriptional regulator [Yinghuangia seranimata]